MLPQIQIGNLSLSTYWMMLVVGAVGMGICLDQRKVRFSLSSVQCILFTCLLTVIGVLGAKVLYILENLQYTLENGISLGGVSFFGSVFLIPLLMPLIGFLFRLKPGQTMDVCGPCVAIMIGCLRVGCFLQGCCGGWRVELGAFSFCWPTQAVDSIWDFAILMWLLNLEQEGKGKGTLYPLFMISYGVMRFLLEFLRDTPKDWLYLSHGQWFSVGAVLCGLVWIAGLKRMRMKYGNRT